MSMDDVGGNRGCKRTYSTLMQGDVPVSQVYQPPPATQYRLVPDTSMTTTVFNQPNRVVELTQQNLDQFNNHTNQAVAWAQQNHATSYPQVTNLINYNNISSSSNAFMIVPNSSIQFTRPKSQIIRIVPNNGQMRLNNLNHSTQLYLQPIPSTNANIDFEPPIPNNAAKRRSKPVRSTHDIDLQSQSSMSVRSFRVDSPLPEMKPPAPPSRWSHPFAMARNIEQAFNDSVGNMKNRTVVHIVQSPDSTEDARGRLDLPWVREVDTYYAGRIHEVYRFWSTCPALSWLPDDVKSWLLRANSVYVLFLQAVFITADLWNDEDLRDEADTKKNLIALGPQAKLQFLNPLKSQVFDDNRRTEKSKTANNVSDRSPWDHIELLARRLSLAPAMSPEPDLEKSKVGRNGILALMSVLLLMTGHQCSAPENIPAENWIEILTGEQLRVLSLLDYVSQDDEQRRTVADNYSRTNVKSFSPVDIIQLITELPSYFPCPKSYP